MEEQVQKRMQALSAEIAELRTKLTVANARIVEDSVIIQNLYKDLDEQCVEIERLREVLLLAMTAIDSQLYPSCLAAVQQVITDTEEK